MSLIKCKECENTVSSKAKICPHCGAKIKKSAWRIVGSIILIVGSGAVFLAVFHWASTTITIAIKSADYYNSGVDHANKGEHDLAISDYTKAIEINPRHASAYCNRGVAYGEKDEYDLAISDYTKAIEVDPKFAGAYYNRGIAFSDKSEYDQAISDYSKAIEINPRFANAYCNRARNYYRIGVYNQAISDCTKTVELNPRDASAYNIRGLAYDEKCEYDLAISDYTKAIEIDPKFAAAYNNRGIDYFQKGKYDKAWEDIYKAQSFGFQVLPEFLKILREASGIGREVEDVVRETTGKTGPEKAFWGFRFGDSFDQCAIKMKELKKQGTLRDLMSGAVIAGTWPQGTVTISGSGNIDVNGVFISRPNSFELAFREGKLIGIEIGYGFKSQHPESLFKQQILDLEKLLGGEASIDEWESKIGNRYRKAVVQGRGVRASVEDSLDGNFAVFSPDIIITPIN